jgi:uncharacterized protein YjbI with pentapeptide repeats
MQEGNITRYVGRAIAFLSMVLMPLLVLLAAQSRFLPYHSVGAAWWQRLIILADILILWIFWPRITSRKDLRKAKILPLLERGSLFSATVASIILMCAATVPDEKLERILVNLSASRNATTAQTSDDVANDNLMQCSEWKPWTYFNVHTISDDDTKHTNSRKLLCITYVLFEQPMALFSMRRNLSLTHADLIVARPTAEFFTDLEIVSKWLADPEQRAKALHYFWQDAGRGIDLRGRDLRFADLSRSDLRKADFRGADLRGAKLVNANLSYATFGDIPVSEIGGCPTDAGIVDGRCVTVLRSADLRGANAEFAFFWKTDLRGADLNGVRLSNAILSHAKLDQAELESIDLTGADLRDVGLEERALEAGISREK